MTSTTPAAGPGLLTVSSEPPLPTTGPAAFCAPKSTVVAPVKPSPWIVTGPAGERPAGRSDTHNVGEREAVRDG